jgi:hypothetical protein
MYDLGVHRGLDSFQNGFLTRQVVHPFGSSAKRRMTARLCGVGPVDVTADVQSGWSQEMVSLAVTRAPPVG